MAMHKRMITLGLPQDQFLRAEAARSGITVSEVIRRIIDELYEAMSGKIITKSVRLLPA